MSPIFRSTAGGRTIGSWLDLVRPVECHLYEPKLPYQKSALCFLGDRFQELVNRLVLGHVGRGGYTNMA